MSQQLHLFSSKDAVETFFKPNECPAIGAEDVGTYEPPPEVQEGGSVTASESTDMAGGTAPQSQPVLSQPAAAAPSHLQMSMNQEPIKSISNDDHPPERVRSFFETSRADGTAVAAAASAPSTVATPAVSAESPVPVASTPPGSSPTGTDAGVNPPSAAGSAPEGQVKNKKPKHIAAAFAKGGIRIAGAAVQKAGSVAKAGLDAAAPIAKHAATQIGGAVVEGGKQLYKGMHARFDAHMKSNVNYLHLYFNFTHS